MKQFDKAFFNTYPVMKVKILSLLINSMNTAVKMLELVMPLLSRGP